MSYGVSFVKSKSDLCSIFSHCHTVYNINGLTHWPLGDSAVILTHWGWGKMAPISQTMLWIAFKRIFMNEDFRISFKISLKFVPKGPINNIQALVQIMAWRWPGIKPLSEPMLVSLLTHICITRPQWVKVVIVKLILSINILSFLVKLSSGECHI